MITFELVDSLDMKTPFESRFFLELMRTFSTELESQISSAKEALDFASNAWDQATDVSRELSRLNIPYLTHSSSVSITTLQVLAIILLPEVETKINVSFNINASCNSSGTNLQVTPEVDVIYGEKYRGDRMADFLKSILSKGNSFGEGAMVHALNELKKKLVAQGRKA